MGTGYSYCNGCSVANLLSNATDNNQTYWWGDGYISGSAGLCSIAVTAEQNIQKANVPNSSVIQAGMILPLITNEDCPACSSAVEYCTNAACSNACSCQNTDGTGYGMAQITPPYYSHLQDLIDYGLAPSSVLKPNGSYDYCPLLASVNKNGPLWSLEAVAIHIAKYMSSGFSTQNLWDAYYAWNGSGTAAEQYANCALNAYNAEPHPCEV